MVILEPRDVDENYDVASSQRRFTKENGSGRHGILLFVHVPSEDPEDITRWNNRKV
jgi:hypothetical protein